MQTTIDKQVICMVHDISFCWQFTISLTNLFQTFQFQNVNLLRCKTQFATLLLHRSRSFVEAMPFHDLVLVWTDLLHSDNWHMLPWVPRWYASSGRKGNVTMHALTQRLQTYCWAAWAKAVMYCAFTCIVDSGSAEEQTFHARLRSSWRLWMIWKLDIWDTHWFEILSSLMYLNRLRVW